MDKQTCLSEAERAYHLLAIGQHVRLVREDGTTVEYSPANISQLDAYIQRLRAELGQVTQRRHSRQLIL
ncbi:phage tail protein [Vibrio cholerae]|nr:phage tail protein [Vibrio cholerae]